MHISWFYKEVPHMPCVSEKFCKPLMSQWKFTYPFMSVKLHIHFSLKVKCHTSLILEFLGLSMKHAVSLTTWIYLRLCVIMLLYYAGYNAENFFIANTFIPHRQGDAYKSLTCDWQCIRYEYISCMLLWDKTCIPHICTPVSYMMAILLLYSTCELTYCHYMTY